MLAYSPDDDSMPRLLGECCFVCPVLCGGGGARVEIIEDQKGSQDLLERSIPRILLAVDLQNVPSEIFIK
jgi:hypothetical protein